MFFFFPPFPPPSPPSSPPPPPPRVGSGPRRRPSANFQTLREEQIRARPRGQARPASCCCGSCNARAHAHTRAHTRACAHRCGAASSLGDDACRHTYILCSTCIHVSMHTYILVHTYMHPCIRICMQTCLHAYMHTCVHAYMRTMYMRTCVHAYMHTPVSLIQIRHTGRHMIPDMSGVVPNHGEASPWMSKVPLPAETRRQPAIDAAFQAWAQGAHARTHRRTQEWRFVKSWRR